MAPTPPRIAQPLLKFGKAAFRAARLVDFGTGSDMPQSEHVQWLAGVAGEIPAARNFQVFIIGFASKLAFRGAGAAKSDAANVRLSFDRANQVARVLERANPRITTRIDQFEAHGNHDYQASVTDNDLFWRAVEVHVFLDQAPVAPPDISPPPPCPGGRRFRQWSLATPAGFVQGIPGLPGAVLAANTVFFRREESPKIIHSFVCPGAGAGVSAVPNLKKILGFLKTFIGGFSVSALDFVPFTAETPFNFGDLDGATCLLASAGGGAVAGFQKVSVTISGQVWFRDSSGKCMFATRSFCTKVDASGKDIQLGAGASAVGGPLVRVS